VAIGASTLRISRQVMTESVVVALLGALAALAVAIVALRVALPLHPRMEPAVLLFLLITSLTTGVLFGLAPAAQSVRADIQSIM
jgi:putative ABC transport system permease protein